MSTSILEEWLGREGALFVRTHPRSLTEFERGERHYLFGAPLHWMRRWPGICPLYVERAAGADLWCVDGIGYADFCLGDTGAMCGHAAPEVTQAVTTQLTRGATFMLPTPAAQWVGAELGRRFGLPYWGFTTSASDANRAAVRIARIITGRDAVLVFNGSYHGSVEEAHVGLSAQGRMTMRTGVHPNAVDHDRVSRVVEFNDLDALRSVLATREVALVLAEPCMTNYGMIEARPGFLAALRELTRNTGTLLLMDETHTWSAGPGGYTTRDNLDPDLFVLGKALGGGIPVGVYGIASAVAERIWQHAPRRGAGRQSSHMGFGGTLAGSALQIAAVRAVLEEVLTADAFASMIRLAGQLAERARHIIARHRLPWCVAQSGARIETMFTPSPPSNASQLALARIPPLETLFHLYMLNRGVLVTPFHGMKLICPATTADHVARYLGVFDTFCGDIAASHALQ